MKETLILKNIKKITSLCAKNILKVETSKIENKLFILNYGRKIWKYIISFVQYYKSKLIFLS